MNSPFKFLEAYTQEDQHLFFGRDEEIEELYEKVFKTNLLLVYGASGTGKTSLIQCGLSSKFSDDNWFSVYIRRQKNINESFLETVSNHSLTKISQDDLDGNESEIVQRVEGLYFDHFKPIYLIFDQLEELFILGDEQEQLKFYDSIKDLASSTIQCKVILILREEYIAYLSGMEDVIHTLFDNRVRIERMRKRKVKEVIEKSCKATPEIELRETEHFLELAINNLAEDERSIELTHLQVYLDKLYRKAEIHEEIHIFDVPLLERTGEVGNVLTEFLEEQVQNLPNQELGWKILKTFITRDGTKKNNSVNGILREISGPSLKVTPKEVSEYIERFLSAKILTQMEDATDLFEFTHDSLAIRTFERLDAKERNLFEIQNFIEQQYHVYEKRGGLLDNDDLSYISPYLEDLSLSKEQKRFVSKSKKNLARRRQFRIRATLAVITVLLASTIFSVYYLIKANELRDEAELAKTVAVESLEKFKMEEAQRKEMEINALFEGAEEDMGAQIRENAIYKLEQIRNIDSSEVMQKRIRLFKEKYDL